MAVMIKAYLVELGVTERGGGVSRSENERNLIHLVVGRGASAQSVGSRRVKGCEQ